MIITTTEEGTEVVEEEAIEAEATAEEVDTATEEVEVPTEGQEVEGMDIEVGAIIILPILRLLTTEGTIMEVIIGNRHNCNRQ